MISIHAKNDSCLKNLFFVWLLTAFYYRYEYCATIMLHFICLHWKSKWQFSLKVLYICWNLPKLKMSWWYISNFYYIEYVILKISIRNIYRYFDFVRELLLNRTLFHLLLMSFFNKKIVCHRSLTGQACVKLFSLKREFQLVYCYFTNAYCNESTAKPLNNGTTEFVQYSEVPVILRKIKKYIDVGNWKSIAK